MGDTMSFREGQTLDTKASTSEKRGKKPWSTKAKFALAGTVLATILGGTGIAYETIPQAHTAINSIFGHGEVHVPPTFDNNAKKINYGDNNIQRITVEEANNQDLLTPKFDEATKTITTMSPFVIPEGTTASQDKSAYEVRGIPHSEPREIIPAGTQIVIPKGMHYRLRGGDPNDNENPNLVYYIDAVKYDKTINKTIFLSLYTYDDSKKEMIPLSTNLQITSNRDIQNAINNWEGGKMDYWNELPTSNGDGSIAATSSNQLIHVFARAFEGEGLDMTKEIKGIEIDWQQQDDKLLVVIPTNQ